jgi:hypothetical protein
MVSLLVQLCASVTFFDFFYHPKEPNPYQAEL